MVQKAGYLRTNWRRTGQVLQVDAIGRGITRGSNFAGSGDGYKAPNGGFIIHRASGIGSTGAASACYQIGANEVLASIYGAGGFGGQGYKILPIQCFTRWISAQGVESTATSAYGIYGSITLSDDSTIRFYAQIASQTVNNIASYFSAVWYWTGFIVSTP